VASTHLPPRAATLVCGPLLTNTLSFIRKEPMSIPRILVRGDVKITQRARRGEKKLHSIRRIVPSFLNTVLQRTDTRMIRHERVEIDVTRTRHDRFRIAAVIQVSFSGYQTNRTENEGLPILSVLHDSCNCRSCAFPMLE